MDFEKLKDLIKAASKATFENLKIKHLNETLTGYALCTDDGAMTIYHIATTQQWAEKGGNFELEFSPVQWQYSDNGSFFDEAYELIMKRVERQDDEENEGKFQELVDRTFSIFVSALLELRAEGVFSESVFLSVLSTDPSDHMLELENKANRELNSSLLFSKWEVWCGQYT
ncbi:DUF4303 domain-containing protein [Pseudoalteromonas sp. NEC-BIFX-2020_002]|uniref:DUF4303 domain-containing protein n=1 Tax=Pseudoalteromonas sp. NEC-BIFX-2020_002 TaxID=2732353 RepID=UPI0014769AD4|nr:DUF4303 domain-containing protein [Pseudoalteromonas sp. NEC-BIFX-2020_002]NNG43574.1 DUF4303 domain-containing protein [Pseudoalteromonas sp. NEC-BIFX-2020_002]